MKIAVSMCNNDFFKLTTVETITHKLYVTIQYPQL